MRLKEKAAQGLAWALCMKSSYLKMFELCSVLPQTQECTCTLVTCSGGRVQCRPQMGPETADRSVKMLLCFGPL